MKARHIRKLRKKISQPDYYRKRYEEILGMLKDGIDFCLLNAQASLLAAPVLHIIKKFTDITRRALRKKHDGTKRDAA